MPEEADDRVLAALGRVQCGLLAEPASGPGEQEDAPVGKVPLGPAVTSVRSNTHLRPAEAAPRLGP